MKETVMRVDIYVHQLEEIANAMIREATSLANLGQYEEANVELNLGVRILKVVEEYKK